MRSGQHPRNLLLQALPAAEFEALRPRLELVELVKDTVLVEELALPRRMSICRTAGSSR